MTGPGDTAEAVPTGVPGPLPGRGFRSIPSHLARRRWPFTLMLAVLATGMAYALLWSPDVRHVPDWLSGRDVWGVWRGAHEVGWGYLGGIYTPAEGLITFPGITVVLAPLAILSGWLGLSESTPAIGLSMPTALLLLQPAELLLAGTSIFAVDAVAERLGVGTRRRIVVCLAAAAAVWPVATLWGHAEDMVAMTFLLYALIDLLDGRWTRCGWLLGLGISFQPLIALAVPIVIAATPAGKRLAVAVRAALLSAVLVGLAVIGDPADTARALFEQPTQPAANHPTPWLAWAPVVSGGQIVTNHLVKIVHGPGGVLYRQIVTVHGRSLVSVSGGAGRLVYLALAVLVGVFVWRRPQPPVRLVWLAAAVLAGRCVFEAVMTPYYLAPPLLLIVVVAATHRRVLRLWVAIAAGTAASVYAYQFVSPWLWWGPIVVLMGVALCCGYPPLGRDGGPEGPESAGIDGPVVSSEAVAAPAESRA